MVYDQKIKQLFKELQIPSTDRKVVNEILQPVDEPFIRDYLQDSFGPTHDFSLKCLDCFSIKPRPNSKFIEKQNKKLLWHGTPPANILPILKDGHKLERASKSSLFGPGIYFTDCSTKAANYTSLSEQKFKGGADTGDVVPSFVTSKVGYLFAAEVSLGKTKYLTKTDSTAYLRYTCNSITAWGKYRQTKKKLSIHVLMLHLVSEVMAFNILIASGTDTGSHQASMSAMFIRFAQAGHHVYIFDTSNPKPVNYGYANIQTLSAYIQPNLTERAEKITKFWRLPFRSTSPSGMHIWGDELLGKFIDDHSEVLTTIMKLKIDLVVIDEIKTHPSAIAKQFHELHGVPFIDFWTTEPYNHVFEVNALGWWFYLIKIAQKL